MILYVNQPNLKSIFVGIGFAILSIVLRRVLEHMEAFSWLWWFLLALGLALILLGLIPSKARDWSKEKVGLIWPKGYLDRFRKPNIFQQIVHRLKRK